MDYDDFSAVVVGQVKNISLIIVGGYNKCPYNHHFVPIVLTLWGVTDAGDIRIPSQSRLYIP